MKDRKRKPTFAEIVSATKEPKSAQKVTGKREPAIAEEVTLYTHEKAAWRVGRIQLIDPYGWSELDPPGIERVKARLASLERLTWSDIFEKDAGNNHAIDVEDFRCPKAKKWMRINLPDQPTLWTIRVTAKERIWGILSEGAYQIVFWDPQHLIWEIPKKDT